MLTLLLDLGFNPDERHRGEGLEEVVYSWGEPLRTCAIGDKAALAEILLQRGADPNPSIYAASTPMFEAYARGHHDVIAALERHGGVADFSIVGSFGLIDQARQMIAKDPTAAASLIDSGAGGGQLEIVRLALEHLDWPRGDARWHWNLMRPLGTHPEADRARYLKCFALIVERSGPDAPGPYGRVILHDVCAGWPRNEGTPEERLALATILLDRGARLDRRDDLLKSTPLGWACRWGRAELVRLFLDRGADPSEPDAEPWATPRAWAEKMEHPEIVAMIEGKRPAG
jgi:Ankyrin repeat